MIFSGPRGMDDLTCARQKTVEIALAQTDNGAIDWLRQDERVEQHRALGEKEMSSCHQGW
jgi:hypothetical protein